MEVGRCGYSGLNSGWSQGERLYPFCRDGLQGRMFFFLLPGLCPVSCLLTVSSLREQAGRGVPEAVCCRFLPSASRGLHSAMYTAWAAPPPSGKGCWPGHVGRGERAPCLGFSPPVSMHWFHRSAHTPAREPDLLALCPTSRHAQ